MTPSGLWAGSRLAALRRQLASKRMASCRAADGGSATIPSLLDNAESFREAMRLVASPVSVVTALDERGIPRGLTCSAFCSLSMTPPSMLICVNHRNRSLEAIRHSGGFLLNLLRAGRMEVSDNFASSLPGKFANLVWWPSPASGLPLLADDALAYVDCGLQAEMPAGSHSILIGRVRASGTSFPDDGPLVYWRRSYGRWVSSEIPAETPAGRRRDHHDTAPQPTGRRLMPNSHEVTDQVIAFIRRTFLQGDPKNELNETTPLLEWGILTSMNTVQLINFVRENFSVTVPPERINGRDFKNASSIAAMVLDLSGAVRS